MEKTLKKKRKEYLFKFGLDCVLAVAAFALAHLLKYGDLTIESLYWQLIPLYMTCWLISSLLSGKFKPRWKKRRKPGNANRLARIKPYTISALFFAGLLSLFLYGSKWDPLSRIIVFGSLAIYFFLEILLLPGVFFGKSRRKEDHRRQEFSSLFFLVEILVIVTGSTFLQYYRKGIFKLTDTHTIILCTLFLLWILIGLVVHKFQIRRDRNYLRVAWPFAKSMFFTLCVLSFLIFLFRMMDFSRLIFGWLAVFAFFEIVTVTAYYFYTKPKETDTSSLSFFQEPLPEKQMIMEVIEKERAESKEYLIPDKSYQSRFIREKLKKRYLKRCPQVFKFIDHVIDLRTIDILDAEVLDSGNPYNIQVLEDNSLEFLLNLHQLNTFGKIDKYLIEANLKLKENGVFISRFEPSEYRPLYFRKKYPRFLANILYVFDFTWRQVFPRIPGLRRLYFTLSRGRNRVLSMAEGFGRLYFCGFEIISLEEVDNSLFFIVKKSKDPFAWFKYFHTFNRIPSYGLLFKQKRVGKDKKPIYIYKMQTMYPYSEFIHKYVLDLQKLDTSGKIKNDFRITRWGKVARRLWLDELPMLINFFKGETKLVGGRPLSVTFFNTYPEDLQEERTKYKPGLIPPFYADLPKGMDEILDSERRYLQRYKKSPLKTDFIYLCKAFKNIVFKGAKSG
ncbi:MAG: hypothetical protein GY950_21930 [bacterium]|nr:hypothetical protein [bacterium]